MGGRTDIVKGRLMEAAGALTGNDTLREEGEADQAVGKPQQFSGTYIVADDLLVLKQGDSPMMVGQVASLANDSFNFKLAGDNPSDYGLTFAR
jgi:hypothetical protein